MPEFFASCDCDCDCDCDCNCGACNASCDLPCNVCQGFCEVGKQAASQNGFNYNFGPWQRDDIIYKEMPQSVYNAMGEAIEAMAGYGNTQDSGGWTWSPETRDFIYADKTNEMIRGANSLGGGTTVQGVPTLVAKESIVYADYFNAIATAIKTMILNPEACHLCNLGCDAQCDACNICNSDDCESGSGGGGG